MGQVTGYDLFEVPPYWLILRLETSDGLVGWGEPTLSGTTKPVLAAVEQLMDRHVLGSDPDRIEDRWRAMYRGEFNRGGPVLMSAIAGIDQALWDLKGKRYGAPVYDLLGGLVRDRIRMYEWIGGDRYQGETGGTGIGDAARTAVEEGYTMVKLYATTQLNRIDTPTKVRSAGERIGAVREAVGPNVDIAIDFHGRATKSMVPKLLDAFAPHDPIFVEEVVRPEHYEALPQLAARTSIPVALGERLYTRTAFKQVFDRDCIDIVQPSVSSAGGITELDKIATMADARDISFAPDCPPGPVSLAATLHVNFSSPNAVVQSWEPSVRNRSHGLLETDPKSTFDYRDGYLHPPDGPGLGIDLDEGRLEELAEQDVEWNHPLWRRDDGSLGEW